MNTWADPVDRSPLLSVLAIGRSVSQHRVRVEFIAIERREAGGVLTFVVVDDTGRDTGQGPLIHSMPVIGLTSSDGSPIETSVVGGQYLDLSRVRYQAVFRPALRTGVTVEAVVEGFEDGLLADLRGPWSSGEVAVI